MTMPPDPYYRADLALVHHRGFAAHASECAPGILALLDPVLARHGTVLELGCGSGLLTRHLIDAGHRVIATDASPAMLELADHYLGGSADLRVLSLPDDPLPDADAVVSVGHAVSYLPDAGAIDRAVSAMGSALLPGGVLAVDVCDLEWGAARRHQPNLGRTGPDWAIVTEFSLPSADRYVRDMTTFVRGDDGTWRRDTEHHENTLVDVSGLVGVLAAVGVPAEVREAFGSETLPVGLRVVVGSRAPDAKHAPPG